MCHKAFWFLWRVSLGFTGFHHGLFYLQWLWMLKWGELSWTSSNRNLIWTCAHPRLTGRPTPSDFSVYRSPTSCWTPFLQAQRLSPEIFPPKSFLLPVSFQLFSSFQSSTIFLNSLVEAIGTIKHIFPKKHQQFICKSYTLESWKSFQSIVLLGSSLGIIMPSLPRIVSQSERHFASKDILSHFFGSLCSLQLPENQIIADHCAASRPHVTPWRRWKRQTWPCRWSWAIPWGSSAIPSNAT